MQDERAAKRQTYHGDLVLGGITDQTFLVVESDVGWGGSVTLVVGDDFYSVLPEDGDTSAVEQRKR